jgi:hypothetical protein
MKRVLSGYFLLAAFILTVIACSKGSGGGGSNNSCASISSFTVTQEADRFRFVISSSTGPLYYEISYQPTNSNPSPSLGLTFTSTISNLTKAIDSLSGVTVGNSYVFYVRSICNNGQGAWSDAKVLAVSPYCSRLVNLGYTSGAFTWQVPSNPNISSFQVQYGIQGFTLGAGTIANVSSSPFTGAQLMMNTSYDFYVRSNCNGGLGAGSWAGPYTFFSAANQNMCIAPSNVSWTVVRNFLSQPIGANFQWNYNGESSFEFTVVGPGVNPNTGNIQTVATSGWPTVLVNQDTDYNFYIRAVCVNGNRTAWTGPVLFNIGH